MAANKPSGQRAQPAIGSERSFGLVFSTVFALVALAPLVHSGVPRWWALIVSAGFAITALLIPRILRPLNRIWFAFGLLLHRIVNPIVMAVMFFGVILPAALVLRAMGKKFLRIQYEPGAKSYWIPREQPAPPPRSMSKQF